MHRKKFYEVITSERRLLVKLSNLVVEHYDDEARTRRGCGITESIHGSLAQAWAVARTIRLAARREGAKGRSLELGVRKWAAYVQIGRLRTDPSELGSEPTPIDLNP